MGEKVTLWIVSCWIECQACSAAVQHVTAGGVAQQRGLLSGDVILYVNNHDLHGLSFSQAKELIHSESHLVLKVVRRSPVSTSPKGTLLISIAIRSEGLPTLILLTLENC